MFTQSTTIGPLSGEMPGGGGHSDADNEQFGPARRAVPARAGVACGKRAGALQLGAGANCVHEHWTIVCLY